jgi:hypothetical protein
MDALYDMTFGEFFVWLEAHKDEVQKHVPTSKDPRYPTHSALSRVSFYLDCAETKKKSENLGRCVLHDMEYGVKNATLFVDPHYFKEWFRYDNTLDWVEETQFHGQRNRFRKVTRGLYPYALGDVSPGVVGICVLAGVADIIPQLHEALYVYWG